MTCSNFNTLSGCPTIGSTANHNGRRKSKRIGNESAAREAAKKIEAKLVLKGFGILEDRKKTTATISHYCGLWLEDYVKQTKRATTYQRYKSLWNTHIKAIIGNAVIDEIKRSDIRNTPPIGHR